MKLISTSTLLFLSTSTANANAGLPPGYDTFMHCPPGSCSAHIPHPRGFVGPKRAFYKCYDETTNEMTEAVWTGYKTEIEAPQGWIQDPPECDSVPIPARVTPPKNIDKPGGLCVTDSDCYNKIRGAATMDPTGPKLCQCYAASSRLPFDETEGGEQGYFRARCSPDACDGFEPYCPLAPNDNGMAECALRPIDTSSSASTSSDDTPPIKKRNPAQSSSTSTSSDDSSISGIVSPTPAPPAQARAKVHVSQS